MLSKYLQRAAFAATVVQFATAQQSKIVPQDLQGAFEDSGREVQVSYTGEATEGFSDGTQFDKDAVSQEPTFALGDSSGITPGLLFTVLMVDTTCENARKLHFVRSNFQTTGDKVSIASESNPILEYKAPGAFGETGDDRQYSFLLYTNPRRSEINDLKLPAEGENFDVQQFQDDNGLQDPSAGLGMVVKLGGQANCDGDAATPAPSDTPAESPQSSSAAAEQPASATSNAAEAPASATSGLGQASSVASGGSGATTAVSQVSSAASSTPTDGSEDSPQSTVQASQTAGNGDSTPSASPSATGASGVNSGITAATSAGGSAAPTLLTSTVVASGVQPDASGATGTGAGAGAGAGASGTSTGLPAVQTENAAPALSMVGGAAVAPLIALAGLLAW